MTFIIGPLMIIGGLGLLFGVGLGIADKFLEVKTDPKLDAIREALPGANCGGCGFAGCGAFAEAVFNGEAPPNGCPVGGAKVATDVAQVLGVDAGDVTKMVAYVQCGGSCDKSRTRYDYAGINSCIAGVMLAGGGSKECRYGCLGLGSCQQVCQFGAVSIVNGLSVIDPDKCTACGACVNECPKNLIELMPYESGTRVLCNSPEKGKDVKEKCEVGCIACRLCVKACQYDAVEVVDNLSVINYDKCVNCGECVLKCPTGTIRYSNRRKG